MDNSSNASATSTASTASWADEVEVQQDYSPTGDGRVKRAASPSYLPTDNVSATTEASQAQQPPQPAQVAEDLPTTKEAPPTAEDLPTTKEAPPAKTVTNDQAVNACNAEMMADNIWTDLYAALALKKSGCVLKYNIKDSWTSEITGDRLFYTGFIKSKSFFKFYEQMRTASKKELRFFTSRGGAEFHI